MRSDDGLFDPRHPWIASQSLLEEVRDLEAELPPAAEIEPWATLSGHEPNNLFLNLGGSRFADVSGLSGVDHEGDARVIAVWDYDRDGRTDLAITNANAPRLQVFRNRLGEGSGYGFVAVRLVGGNRRDQPSERWSARDGYGARVVVTIGDERRVTEHRCGEGFAAQNSATRLIGLGDRDQVDSLTVVWPSGVIQATRGVPAASLVTVYEDPRQGPGDKAFEIIPYEGIRRISARQ